MARHRRRKGGKKRSAKAALKKLARILRIARK